MSIKYWQRANISGWQNFQPAFENFVIERMTKIESMYNYISRSELLQACPDLVSTLEANYSQIERVIIFRMTEQQMTQRLENQFIHVDSSIGNQDARLNWPILNPNSVLTKYFIINRNAPMPTRYFVNPPYPDYIDVYDSSCCQEVDAVCVNEPTIFSVVHPHGMFINGNQWPRIMASINFHGNVLKKYLQKDPENS